MQSKDPGVYDDLGMVEYHDDTALGHGEAVTLLDDCPRRFQWDREHPKRQSREFDIGTACHVAILQPAEFNEQMLVLPPEFKDYKKKDAQALRDSAYITDRTPLLDKEFQSVTRMTMALRDHPIAGPLLTGGIAEQSLFWQDEATGIMRKCRPDYRLLWKKNRLGEECRVINLKTAASAHPEAIRRNAWDHGWHSSEAWTRDGLAAHGIAVSDYLYVVVEKTEPHMVCVYRLPDRLIDMGRIFNRKAVQVFAECTKSGIWPDYGERIIDIEPPRYAEVNFETDRVSGRFE